MAAGTARRLAGRALCPLLLTATTACAPAHSARSVPSAHPAGHRTGISPAATVPDTPAALAADLASVEAAIRSTSATDLPALGGRQQDDYRLLLVHPDWQPAVLDRVPEQLRPTVVANVAAGNDLQTLSGTVGTVPHWHILHPPPAETLMQDYREAEARYGVRWPYLAAIHFVESRMGRIDGDSSAGAQGPMQFLPSTWAEYGEGDVRDPHAAILAAARYLRAHGAPDDMGRALYAYNPSTLYVDAITRYAGQMLGDARAYLGYHAWQVYISTPSGDVLMPEGYGG